MRVERNCNHHSSNCWLTIDEYENLRWTTDSYRNGIEWLQGIERWVRNQDTVACARPILS